MRSKHNKKRNTAFLYEVLIRELTKSIVESDAKRKECVVDTIKQCFKKGTILREELELYKSLLESENLNPKTAERLLVETKTQYNKLDKRKLFLEQSALISKINKNFEDVLQIFVPNYKSIATIYQIFNGVGSPKKQVMLEERILETITSAKEKKVEQQPISNLAFKTFVKKFNSVYGGALLKEQQELLSKYVTSFEDNSVGLKFFLNEELERIKAGLQNSFQLQELQEDSNMMLKTQNVIKIVENFRNKPIDTEMLEQILKIQQLVKEMES